MNLLGKYFLVLRPARRLFHTCSFVKNANTYSTFHHQKPTIYALSTAPGKAAVAIIRVSGPQSAFILSSLTNGKKLPSPRASALRKLYTPGTSSQKLLDHALVILFQGPKSFTGEDLLELHLHGGVATVKSVLSAIKSLNDNEKGRFIRYAENGEFTKRAFQNGRLDLTEAEGIRDMIDAETESQRMVAINSMEGYNKKFFTGLRKEIVHNSAMLSALIDFGDDYEVDEVDTLMNNVAKKIESIQGELLEYLKKAEKTQILLDGVKTALLGPTNAGKSSLLNQIANKDAAIVSNIAGTTRDIINFPLDINGYKVIVSDTAGIRSAGQTNDIIEIEGIKRAKKKALESDLILIILPADLDIKLIEPAFIEYVKQLQSSSFNKQIKLIINKTDLIDNKEKLREKYAERFNLSEDSIKFISCLTREGIDDLVSDLTKSFKLITESGDADPIGLSERSRDIIANDILFGFEEFFRAKDQGDVVMASEALNLSIEGIGKITGEAVGVEEILGVIFSTFCIGK
ncbi:Mss1 protein [Saccharomycopsis crataegensis]|uniref:Mss1 protein n=1 Tax=Saccharomycopsis crataegensis TaxID=43959 RepID=A0AAV5QVY5_9ASCO|nr:Mss1 protein [Saccharomycopsis crataegensis]